ncbi:7b735fe2-cc99-487a-a93f-7a3cd6400b56 [Thermothielavioides terrestris]
MLNNY